PAACISSRFFPCAQRSSMCSLFSPQMNTDCHRFKPENWTNSAPSRPCGIQWKRDDSQVVPPSVLICENLWLSLRFHLDLGFHRICNETLLVRAMIHLLDFLRRWLLLAGEFETLPQRHPGDG